MGDQGEVPPVSLSGFAPDQSSASSSHLVAQGSVVELIIDGFTPLYKSDIQQLYQLGAGTQQIGAILDNFQQLGMMLADLQDPSFVLPSNAGALFEKQIAATRSSIEALPSGGAVGGIKGSLLSMLQQINGLVTGCSFANMINDTMKDVNGISTVLQHVLHWPQSEFNSHSDSQASLMSKYFTNLQSQVKDMNNYVAHYNDQYPNGPHLPSAFTKFVDDAHTFLKDTGNIEMKDNNRAGITFNLKDAVEGNSPHIPLHSFLNDLNRAYKNSYRAYMPRGTSVFDIIDEQSNTMIPQSKLALESHLPPQAALEQTHELLTASPGSDTLLTEEVGSLVTLFDNATTGYFQAQETLTQSAGPNIIMASSSILYTLRSILQFTQKQERQQYQLQSQLISEIKNIR